MDGDDYLNAIFKLFDAAVCMYAEIAEFLYCVEYGVDDDAVISDDAAYLLRGTNFGGAEQLIDAPFQLADAHGMFGRFGCEV